MFCAQGRGFIRSERLLVFSARNHDGGSRSLHFQGAFDCSQPKPNQTHLGNTGPSGKDTEALK